MYNELLRIVTKNNSILENNWVNFVKSDFSDEQMKVFKFLLNSFPEDLLITEGNVNSDIISIITLMAYNLGETRDFINNLKKAKDLDYLSNENRNILKWDEGQVISDYKLTNPSEDDMWYDSEEAILYTYITGTWNAGENISLSKIEDPDYNDRWIDPSKDTLYTFNNIVTEEIPLSERNKKLLLPLLEDAKFYLLETTDDIDDKLDIIKNYKILSKDSYMFLKNRGTENTLKRIISSFLFDRTGLHSNITFTDTGGGDITITLEALDGEDTIDLIDFSTQAGAGPYTYEIKKDSLLYRYLMFIKPAGINYTIQSEGNSETGLILSEPTISFVSADYNTNSYTVDITNTGSEPVSAYIGDYATSDGSMPAEGSLTKVSLSANESKRISRTANTSNFSNDGFNTTIGVYIKHPDAANSTTATVIHEADNPSTLEFIESDLSVTKAFTSNEGGYITVSVINRNPVPVSANLSVEWLTSDILDSKSFSVGAESSLVKTYDNPNTYSQDATISCKLTKEGYSDSPIETETIYGVEAKYVEPTQLAFVSDSLTVEKGSDIIGGYVDVIIKNTNSVEVTAEFELDWGHTGVGVDIDNDYSIASNKSTNTLRFRNPVNQTNDAGISVRLIDPSGTRPASTTQTKSVSSIISRSRLKLEDTNLTLTRDTDANGGLVRVTIYNQNNISVNSDFIIAWENQLNDRIQDSIPAKASITREFYNTTDQSQNVDVSGYLIDPNDNYIESPIVSKLITSIAPEAQPTYVKAFDYLGSSNSSTFITTQNYSTTTYRTISQGCIAAESTEGMSTTTYAVGDIIRRRVMVEDPKSPLGYSDCNPAYRWFEVIEVLE